MVSRRKSMGSYLDSEAAYEGYIARCKWAKDNRGTLCPSINYDWRALGDESFPTSPHAIFTCLVCDAVFPWSAGNEHVVPLIDEDCSVCDGFTDDELKIPWWGWPIVIAVVPLAIPVAITVIAGERVCQWWTGRRK
jgi:hypothetical protein